MQADLAASLVVGLGLKGALITVGSDLVSLCITYVAWKLGIPNVKCRPLLLRITIGWDEAALNGGLSKDHDPGKPIRAAEPPSQFDAEG